MFKYFELIPYQLETNILTISLLGNLLFEVQQLRVWRQNLLYHLQQCLRVCKIQTIIPWILVLPALQPVLVVHLFDTFVKSVHTMKLNVKLRKIFVRCYIWQHFTVSLVTIKNSIQNEIECRSKAGNSCYYSV